MPPKIATYTHGHHAAAFAFTDLAHRRELRWVPFRKSEWSPRHHKSEVVTINTTLDVIERWPEGIRFVLEKMSPGELSLRTGRNFDALQSAVDALPR